MAKPIEATPVLSGKDAEVFISDIRNPILNDKEKSLFRELLKLEKSTAKR